MDLGVYNIDARFSDLFIEKGENSKEFLLVSKKNARYIWKFHFVELPWIYLGRISSLQSI